MSKFLKVLKFSVFCALIYGLTFYVKESYVKLKVKPEVLVKEKLVSSQTIPFPAITICAPLLAKIEILNITNCFGEIGQGKIPKKRNLQKLVALSHVCTNFYAGLVKIAGNLIYSFDEAAILNAISPEILESFSECSIDGRLKCDNIFIRSLTDYGYCFSFNMVEYHEIFNEGISDHFDAYKRKTVLKSFDTKYQKKYFDETNSHEPSNWSIQNGYPINYSSVQPMRASKGRAFLTQYRVKGSNVFNFCGARNFVLFVFLHLPNEIPTFMHQEYAYKAKTAKVMKISAEIKENDETLQNFAIKERECFFEGERSLRFFKSYTKNNCEYECMINFTLQHCRCVRLTMPRTNDMKVCGLKDIECYRAIPDSWPNFYYADQKNQEEFPDFPCGCMPLCTQIKYTISDKISVLNYRSDDYFYSTVMILFEDSQIVKRTNYVTYKILNFMSDVGGLLGLFLGFSLLSLFELLLRICSYLKKKIDQWIEKLNQKVEDSSKVVSLVEVISTKELERNDNQAENFMIQELSRIQFDVQDLEYY